MIFVGELSCKNDYLLMRNKESVVFQGHLQKKAREQAASEFP